MSNFAEAIEELLDSCIDYSDALDEIKEALRDLGDAQGWGPWECNPITGGGDGGGSKGG